MRRLGILVFLFTASAFAAPLVDLAGGDEKALPRERPLNQEDLVYTDNIKSDDSLLKDAARVLFAVPGRAKPQRNGKVIHKFRANDLVRILRDSRDKRWVGVETLLGVGSKGKKVRAWVPKNSVKPPPPPEAPTEPHAAEGEGAPRDAAMPPSEGAPAPAPEGAPFPLQ